MMFVQSVRTGLPHRDPFGHPHILQDPRSRSHDRLLGSILMGFLTCTHRRSSSSLVRRLRSLTDYACVDHSSVNELSARSRLERRSWAAPAKIAKL